jgi:hypothetical protein
MTWQSLIADVADLLSVAQGDWLNDQRSAAVSATDLQRKDVEREKSRARLRRVTSHMQRVAEIDARIALLDATPGVSGQADFLYRLRMVRCRLVKSAKGRD